MQFASDNWSGASPRIIAALAEAAHAGGPAYGEDPLTRRVEAQLAEVFEHDVAVFLVGSGTAANALALSAYARPGGVIFAHHEAHTRVDEAGAVEFFGGGARIAGLASDAGKISPATLDEAVRRLPEGGVHHGQPVAVSIAQITELGAVYQADEIAALGEEARRHGIAFHMDGARLANALATLRAAPADITWRAGVDALSLGGTKNGCIAAEAVIFFNPADARDTRFARQRAGQGFSKNWFIAAQLEAYLADGHWLELAAHANAMAAHLSAAILLSRNGRLAFNPEGNEIFAILKAEADERLRAAGAMYYPAAADSVPAERLPGADERMVRLVTSWQTSRAEVDAFSALLG